MNITFVFNDIVGGVATMNLGIINQSYLTRSFAVRIVLICKDFNGSTFLNTNEFDPEIECVLFKYSSYDNYNKVISRLSRVLAHNDGPIITNDGLDVDSLRFIGNKNVVYHIVHDLYNFNIALRNRNVIDYFICHTAECFRLLSSDPNLENRVFYLPFGVEVNELSEKVVNDKVRIISLSRLTLSKGVMKLICIENELLKLGIDVDWFILGEGPLEQQLLEQWNGKNNVLFLAPDNTELKRFLKDADFFVSLSEFEGYGISLLEALSYGLIPIIKKLPIGIHSQLNHEFACVDDNDNFGKMALFIKETSSSVDKLVEYRVKAHEFVRNGYWNLQTGQEYFKLFNKSQRKKTSGVALREDSPFGFLDNRYLPNFLIWHLKKMREYLK
jgi:glycosyltransferase involved in cell wall biosynthesis